MAMSIETALQLEVFSRVAVTVHAGQRNLDRSVRWVHPTEIPDIAQFLSGGEMLLTAGLGIVTPPALSAAISTKSMTLTPLC
jgi:purine catabolism regulator